MSIDQLANRLYDAISLVVEAETGEFDYEGDDDSEDEREKAEKKARASLREIIEEIVGSRSPIITPEAPQ